MHRILVTLIVYLLAIPGAQAGEGAAPVTGRPVHTCSIVARDPESGQLGVAVQSHGFSVGSLVPWAQAGLLDADEMVLGRINAAGSKQGEGIND